MWVAPPQQEGDPYLRTWDEGLVEEDFLLMAYRTGIDICVPRESHFIQRLSTLYAACERMPQEGSKEDARSKGGSPRFCLMDLKH